MVKLRHSSVLLVLSVPRVYVKLRNIQYVHKKFLIGAINNVYHQLYFSRHGTNISVPVYPRQNDKRMARHESETKQCEIRVAENVAGMKPYDSWCWTETSQ